MSAKSGGSKGAGAKAAAAKGIKSFPAGAASDLINIGAMVAQATEVKQATELARKLKPNGPAILGVAQKWYAASERIGGSSRVLNSAYKGLDIYWDGDAFDAFSSLMGDVTDVASRNSDVLFDIGNNVVDLYNTAAQSYNEAVLAIGETLQKVAPLDPDKQDEEVLHTLTTFVADMKTRKQNLENDLSVKQGKIVQLHGQILRIQAPDDVPSGVTDKRKWKFSPR
ncbi:hypothetical protein [Actinoallomurus sp. NPDC052274]|uniref:WXG100 family type VII secretion target n=1 Tax=Actinoallomurus sp. NPDC052274 TaxID=3155420 RepID=UPI0034330C9B